MDLDFLLEKVVYQILQRNNFSNRQWATKERQDAREPGLDSKLGSSGISLFNRSAITWMSLSGISRVSMLSAPYGRLSWTRMGSCSACKDFSAFLGYWTSQKSKHVTGNKQHHQIGHDDFVGVNSDLNWLCLNMFDSGKIVDSLKQKSNCLKIYGTYIQILGS